MLRAASIGAIVLALVAIMVSGPSSVAAKSRTIEEITIAQKRYVLFNSRRLSGECLDICVTKNPTASPTIESDGSTPDPTASPTVPICEDKKVINVCLALDNSGSICSSGNSAKLCNDCNSNEPCEQGGVAQSESLCCGNYEKVTQFATSYINNLDGLGSFSVVKYGSTASVISPQGTAENALTFIETSPYTGGFTNTEDAIGKCRDELQNKDNPVIVLITDGTPTACRKKAEDGNYSGYYTSYWGNCGKTSCPECLNGAPIPAAELMADKASDDGMSLVPVIISSVSDDTVLLEKLARCPSDSDDCDINDYKGLHVDNIENIDDLLETLVLSTGCE